MRTIKLKQYVFSQNIVSEQIKFIFNLILCNLYLCLMKFQGSISLHTKISFSYTHDHFGHYITVTAKFCVFGIFIHLLVCLRICLPVIMFVICLGHCLSIVLLLSEFLLWLVPCYVLLWLICKSVVRASFCVCLGSCLID